MTVEAEFMAWEKRRRSDTALADVASLVLLLLPPAPSFTLLELLAFPQMLQGISPLSTVRMAAEQGLPCGLLSLLLQSAGSLMVANFLASASACICQ